MVATGLGYDEFKDHPIQETYEYWARQYLRDPSQVPTSEYGGIGQVLSDPGFTLQFLLDDPQVQTMLEGSEEARTRAENALGRRRNAVASQRGIAAQQRAIQRKRLDFKLDTGLRDIEQGRQSGLEAAVNNALQRGIYRSGIRVENEAEVERESDEAGSDLKTQIDLALQELRNRGAATNAGLDAQLAGIDASQATQDAQGSLTIGDLAATAEGVAEGINFGEADQVVLPNMPFTSPTPQTQNKVKPIQPVGGGGGGSQYK